MGAKDEKLLSQWREEAERLEEEREEMRQKFLQEVGQRTEGISAQREKFVRGLEVGNHKVPPNE